MAKEKANSSSHKSRPLTEATTEFFVFFDLIHDKGEWNADRANQTTTERLYQSSLDPCDVEKLAGLYNLPREPEDYVYRLTRRLSNGASPARVAEA